MNNYFIRLLSLKVIKKIIYIGVVALFTCFAIIMILSYLGFSRFWIVPFVLIIYFLSNPYFISFFLLPLLILSFNVESYFLSVTNGQKINFIKDFKKGVILSILVGIGYYPLFGLVELFFSTYGSTYGFGNICSGEGCLGYILFLLSALIIGSLFSLIFTTVLYFKSKNKISSSI